MPNVPQEYTVLNTVIKVDNNALYEGYYSVFDGILSKFLKLLAKNKRIGNYLFSLSNECQEIKKFAATHKALEIIYTHNLYKPVNIIDAVASKFWLNIKNGRAARNRLKLVKRELKSFFSSITKDEINILSVGSGSARAIIESIHEFNDKKFNLMLIDISEDALEYSRELADRLGIRSIILKKGNVLRLRNLCKGFTPDVIEMVGLLDYFGDRQVSLILRQVAEILPPNGIFITCNIRNNPEKVFLDNIIEWNGMFYREPQELIALLQRNFPYVYIVYEPLGIHGVIVANERLLV